MVRHSHQDALDDAEYQALLESVDRVDPPNDAETLLILVAGGRLGMRAGDAHSD
jgi:hypothetical protein